MPDKHAVLSASSSGRWTVCTPSAVLNHVPVEKNGVNGELRQKGKISELALGYGGASGALKAMGAIDMGLREEELKPLVDAWRTANQNIVQFWWDIDKAAKDAIRMKTEVESRGFTFTCRSGMLFIKLPSGRSLSYVKPHIGVNRFGWESITYMKESELERRFTDTVKHKGGLALKFVSPGYDGMPDRLVLFENGRMGFVEVKAPGKKPRHLQAARHRMLRMMGYKVFVLDSEDDMERMADEIRTA